MMMTDERMTSAQAMNIEQAATALNVAPITIRRRIRSGELRAEKVPGKFGAEYRVYIDEPLIGVLVDDQSPSSPQNRPEQGPITADNPAINGQIKADQGASSPHTEGQSSALIRDLLAVNRALQDERAQLYGQIGFLQGQLETAKERIALLEGPRTSPEASTPEASPSTSPRPWWAFWRRGT